MKKLLALLAAAMGIVTSAYAATIDLSDVTADTTLANGDVATGWLGANVKISITDGATVTLRDATINGVNNSDYSWAGITCKGNATINLEGDNTVKGFDDDYPAIFIPEGKTLTIQGEGSLSASSSGFTGYGIGGGYNTVCGNITIVSGTITATGGSHYGTGIGSGSGLSAGCGNITIIGGTVTATGSPNYAGIGSGAYASCGDITISGGTVNVTDGNIGSGANGSCGNITIGGGVVTVTGNIYQAGIGSGEKASCGDITINGGTVTATGGSNGAGIGSGRDASCGDITISSGVDYIAATGGYNAAPIGAGAYGSCGEVNVAGNLADTTEGGTRTIMSRYFTVTFNANGGTVDAAERHVGPGLAVGELPVPVWSGEGNYAFTGWFTAASGGTEVTAATVVTDNMALYAHWVESPFSTGGNAAWTIDGDGSWKSGKITHSQKTWAEIAVTAPCVVSFQWKTSSEKNYDKLYCYLIGNGETNEVVSAISGAMSDWAEVSFAVDGSGSRTVRFEYAKDSIGLSGDDCGWVKDFETSAVMVLTFDANGGTVSPDAKQIVENSAVGELPVPVWNGEGDYLFTGWFTSATGGDKVTSATVVSDAMTLYAHWIESPYDATGGYVGWTVETEGDYAGCWKSGDIPDDTNTWAEVAVTEPCTVLFKWKTSSESGCDKLHCYLVGNGETNEVVSAISGVLSDWAAVSFAVDGSGSRTVRFEYAKDSSGLSGDDCGWVKDFTVAHVLTFDGNGGSVDTAELVVAEGKAAGELPEPVWTGEGTRYFRGWFTAATGGSKVTAATVINADMTLYAHWVAHAIVNLGSLTGDIILHDGEIATGTLAGRYKISIADGAEVTLSDVTINLSQASGSIWAGITCEGSATIVLEGENVVKSLNEYCPGIYVPQYKTLTIQGGGALTAIGGQFYGAGIGAGYGSSGSCGSIVIEGGTVIATSGGFAAGIGCGFGSNCDDITISGGTVTAMGGAGCAGIGGSTDMACGNIEISGGTVTAMGGEKAAGIGTGSAYESYGECGYITISGGTVTATGGTNAAGIGTGEDGYCYGITIGADITRVTATCGGGDAEPIGLGGGDYSECMNESNISSSLSDTTTGSTRVLEASGESSAFDSWAESKGLAGADAAWDAKPAKWNGWANAFIYTYGEGLADGTVAIMAISFGTDGMPIITTTPVLEGRTDFTPSVIGSSAVDNWTAPVILNKSGDTWTLPSGYSANFFRVRLTE